MNDKEQINERIRKIVDCLKIVANGRIGKIERNNGNMKYITEVYPYKDGMYILYVIHDVRSLLFKDRKLLVFIDKNSKINLIGECDIKTSQSIDTCITEEYLDAMYVYQNMKERNNSLFFRKKHRKEMEEKINYCKNLAINTLKILEFDD